MSSDMKNSHKDKKSKDSEDSINALMNKGTNVEESFVEPYPLASRNSVMVKKRPLLKMKMKRITEKWTVLNKKGKKEKRTNVGSSSPVYKK